MSTNDIVLVVTVIFYTKIILFNEVKNEQSSILLMTFFFVRQSELSIVVHTGRPHNIVTVSTQ